ncbi:MAG: hypothetical protein WD119_01215 [Pirellulaceae bacterium]
MEGEDEEDDDRGETATRALIRFREAIRVGSVIGSERALPLDRFGS